MTNERLRRGLTLLGALTLAACGADPQGQATAGEGTGVSLTGDDPTDGDSSSSSSSTTGPASSTTMQVTSAGGSDEGTVPPPPVNFDLGGIPDTPFAECAGSLPVPCDHTDDDPWHAIGLNCPGGVHVDGQVNGDPLQFYVHEGDLGTFVPAPYPPREGDKFLVMSSGHAADITMAGLFASNDVAGFIDNGADLPLPMNVMKVSNTEDCASDESLIGTGDCSNTIEDQWNQGSGAYDYAELRFTVGVPQGNPGFSYDLAMFSTEYPDYYQSGFNDMYVGWLESELWTGNVSFDEMGHPISLNAGFLDYKDAPNPFDCPPPCAAPELGGTAMEGHAGTKWLTTTAGVLPGEEITLILAVFDLSDPVLDTVVLLDNFQFGCVGGPPVTIPG
ncbi:MAG: choice-of-anchor L domain-containing protein [Nannocystaceae bacterium]|nr:choice-of-anchor L domain-containing protein [Nannocystaceae bacterium]